MKLFVHKNILAALFIFSVAMSVHVEAIGAMNASNETEAEPGSALVLRSALRASSWCPEKRMTVVTASGSRKVTLNASRKGHFTAYVNDQFVPENNIRVTKKEVSICVPRHGEPAVLMFGSDSKGLPVEYSNVK